MTSHVVLLIPIGIAILFSGIIAVMGIFRSMTADGDLTERLETYAQLPDATPKRNKERVRNRVIRFRFRINAMLSMFSSDELSLRLVSANWPITETEYILIRIWSAVAGLTIGWFVFRSIFPGIGIAVIAFLAPSIYLTRSLNHRRTKFDKQLVDVLILVTGAVRSGYSFLQALDIVVQEMKAPAAEEFRRVRREVGLGLPLSQALNNLHERMQNDDLYLVITAVNINTQVGGNLVTMLEVVTNTIRERSRLFSEIRALTSQQRFSGYLLTLLPFILTAVLFIISPEYIARLFNPGPLVCIPIGALFLVLLGNITIRMMSKLDA